MVAVEEGGGRGELRPGRPVNGQLTVETTAIPGLLIVRLPVHGDSRGWFKENWQRARMVAAGLPDFGPVQNNVSYNAEAGVTRGLHAEPWDKYVSVGCGRVFGAWADLREGASFGTVVTSEIGPDTAVFVPRGVANGFQTLEPGTSYSYLVNQHWSEAARSQYAFVNVRDPALAIAWPRDLDAATMSDADRTHPLLADVAPVAARRTLILGGRGQLGRALSVEFPDAEVMGREQLDLTSSESLGRVDWGAYDQVINAAAYTNVDGAETAGGRRDAWRVNVEGVAAIAEAVRRHGATLVHVSSDYVFDGSRADTSEDEPLSPLGVYGATKAAGELIVGALSEHYVIRTSWVVGEGGNFVRTMARLADHGVTPSVVSDQVGRLTTAAELARAIRHLLESGAAYGTYNVTCSGPPTSWADVAATVFEARGRSRDDVRRVSSEEYLSSAPHAAPRPRDSTLSLDKLAATGFVPTPAAEALAAYLGTLE